MGASHKSIEMNRAPVANSGVIHLLALGFLLVCALPFILTWDLQQVLVALVRGNDTFSQIPVIPLVSFVLIYGNREAVFSEVSFGWDLGASLITPGMVFLFLARLNFWQLSVTNQMSLLVLGMVFLWMGAFALFFGKHAFWSACFPLLFLLFAIPIPEPLLSNLIYCLQKGSAGAAEVFFRMAGVPHLRQGFEFALPGVTIRVAEECSGIRSTLAIFITTILACHLFLRSIWRKSALCIVVVPVAIIKNGLRIAALSTLAIYVDPGFLHGNLHHYGGIVFFAFALVPMTLLLMLLQKGENPRVAVAKHARARGPSLSAS